MLSLLIIRVITSPEMEYCSSLLQVCRARRSVLKGKKVDLPKRITVTDHFTDLIQNGTINGDQAAIMGDNSVVLYSSMQLDMTANKLAKAMRRKLGYWTSNNPDGDLVIGFCLHTTENAILMILAIMKLGGTYLAISTTYPEQQIVRIVGITRPLLIITESDPQIQSRFDCVKHVCEISPIYELVDNSTIYEDDPNDPVPLESLSPPWKRAACIVLTAGTTGEPRFVRIGHLAILNRLYWQYKAIPYEIGEIACLSSLMVDAESVAEVLAPLLGGTPLYIISRQNMRKPSALLSKIKDDKISRITMTPSGLAGILTAMDEMVHSEAKDMLKTLKYMIISGDILTIKTGLKYFRIMDASCPLVYFYGATEVMSEGSCEVFKDVEDFKDKVNADEVSIGLPLCNSTIYIMDEDLNIVPKGTIGEICISGTSVAMGYSDNRDLTARFVQYPPQAKKSAQIKIFRTGDYGKISQPDGSVSNTLFYEGRIDMMMKVQGREIELNSIETTVRNTQLCQECAVLCFHRNREDQAAVAFCILNEGVQKQNVIDALKNVLHDSMVPDIYPVAELPYLPSGRLDRQKLLKVYKYRRMESTPEEWKALNLGVAQKQAAKVLFEAISHTIGLNLRFVMENYASSFWSIGGNSLNALVIAHMCRENGYLISIDEFVLAESLSAVVALMVNSGKHPVTDAQMLIHMCELAEWTYGIEPLHPRHKHAVIHLLSKSFGERDSMSILVGAHQRDWTSYLERVWDIFLKENLGIAAIEKATGKIIAAALSRDVNSNTRSMNSHAKHASKQVAYCLEAFHACEHIARQTTVNKDRGKIMQIYMMGTDSAIESRFNIVLIEYLLKGSMQRGLFNGFSWTLIIGDSPLIRDLCGSILQYDLIAEIKLNSFVAKDKTKPFRRAGDYQSVRAYYRLFT